MFVVLVKLRKYLQYSLVYEKCYNKIVLGKREISYFVQIHSVHFNQSIAWDMTNIHTYTQSVHYILKTFLVKTIKIIIFTTW